MKRQARLGARRRWAGAAALIVGLAAGLPAPAQGVELDALAGLVGHWMELRTTLADETRDWAARRQQWQDEIDLLEQEEAALTREIEDNRRFSSGVEQNRSAALAREAEGERELKALRAVLDRAEADLRSWEPRLPPGLRDPLASGLGALPANRDEAKNLALTKRARTVAALYAQIGRASCRERV